MPTETIQKLTFKNIIMTIGNLPSSYVESLSYYECMLWLCNYLQNTVIPAINNNGEAVEELQGLYVELKTYVDNYFDNLDVQEEIDKKIDEMVEDGTLTTLIKNYIDPLYQAYENEIDGVISGQNQTIQTAINSQNQRISVVEDQVGNAIGSTPLVASSTSGMTNTNKIYVNTTDGNWYYYDGDSWEIGGTYQSTGINDGSIGYTKLDTDLNSLFSKGITFLSNGELVEGHYKTIDGSNNLVDHENAYWGYWKVDISSYAGKIMYFTGTSYGTNYGFIITDTDEKAIWNCENVGNTITMISHFIPVPLNAKYIYLQSNIGFYVNPNLNDSLYYEAVLKQIGIVNNLKQVLNYNATTEMESIYTINNWYFNKNSVVGTGDSAYMKKITGADYTIKSFRINKGVKYKITGTVAYSNEPFVITNDIFVISERATTQYAEGTFEKIFIANEDGYILTSNYPTSENKPTHVYVYDRIDVVDPATSEEAGVIKVGSTLEIDNSGILNINNSSYLSGYKVGFTGDSICAGNGYAGGYAKIMNEMFGLQYQNIGVSGGHITHDSDEVFIISNSIDDLANDCDAYIIEGGHNDYTNSVNFGSISPDYTSALNQETFCGALEKICRDLYYYHAGKHYAFLIVHNVNDSYTYARNGKTWKDYRDTIYQICTKYGVDVIDIGHESMNTYSSYMKETYTTSSDGLHPNQDGYTEFYIPEIKAWLDKVFDLK